MNTNSIPAMASGPVVHEVMGCGQKSIKLVWRCHQLLSGFLGKGHLLQVSHQSSWSPNDKSDNEMIPGAMHRSPGICHTVRKTPENLS